MKIIKRAIERSLSVQLSARSVRWDRQCSDQLHQTTASTFLTTRTCKLGDSRVHTY
jgi:hypothetical protein